MQVTLAALGLLSSIAAWLAGATFWWLVGGVLLGSVIPFTLIVILPTNKQLLSPGTGQAVGRNGAATRTLGQIACRANRAEHGGAVPVPLPRSLHEIRLTPGSASPREWLDHHGQNGDSGTIRRNLYI